MRQRLQQVATDDAGRDQGDESSARICRDASNVSSQHFKMVSKTKWKRGPELDRIEDEPIDFQGSVQGGSCSDLVCRAGFDCRQQEVGHGPSRPPRQRLREPAASLLEITPEVVRETKRIVPEKDGRVVWIARQR